METLLLWDDDGPSKFKPHTPTIKDSLTMLSQAKNMPFLLFTGVKKLRKDNILFVCNKRINTFHCPR